jgi:uncharacterized protein with HEPN domain/predicted nucleotidyltransferase
MSPLAKLSGPRETLDQRRVLEKYQRQICDILARHGLTNPRLFGSVRKGTYRPNSDIDLLVDADSTATLLSLAGAQSELAATLGVSVDLRTSEELSERFRQNAISESCSLSEWKALEPGATISPRLRDNDYLHHIQEAIAKIHRHASTKEEFLRSEPVQDSIIRGLEIVGEAVSRLSPQLKNKYPEVPWENISGMRNRLIHGYFDVDLERVWKTIEDDIPDFERAVSQIASDQD